MDIGNAPVTNDANESYGTISLQQAFAVSSNVVFGQVANEVGANALSCSLPTPLATAKSSART